MRYKVENIDANLIGFEGEIKLTDLFYDIEIETNTEGLVSITRDKVRLMGIIDPEDGESFVFDTKKEHEHFTIKLDNTNDIDRLIPFMVNIDWLEQEIRIE